MFDKEALALNPTPEERGRVIRDGFVVTRRDQVCFWCEELIDARSRVRRSTEVIGGQILTSYFCEDCTRALISAWRNINPDLYYIRHSSDGCGITCKVPAHLLLGAQR